MTREELASAALASWTIKALEKGHRAIGRQELPDMNLSAFFRAFQGASQGLRGVSLALVGFGSTKPKLLQIAAREAPGVFAHLAVDLHTAAGWRNHRQVHRTVI